MTDAPAIRSVLDLGAISCKVTRDALRRAATAAKHGPVWIERRDGTVIAAIVTAEDAAYLRELRRNLHDGTGGIHP